jgi:divalent metal cation (Fe/Co/Zn/Cd) transporter
MYCEAIHSTVDTGNELLLLFGMRRAEKPPDSEHPFGYGLQLYFWVFVVAVMIFGLGALVAFYEGRYSMPSRPGTWWSTTLSWALRSCSRLAHGLARFANSVISAVGSAG